VDDLAKHLDRLEEMLHAITSKVGNMDMNQQGLGVVLVRLEKQVSGMSDSNSTRRKYDTTD
jgi:hypothetical protein